MATDNFGNAFEYLNGSWSEQDIDGTSFLYSVSCASPTFCTAVDGGSALTYNGTSWSSADDIDGSNPIASVSCPTAMSCVAVDKYGGTFGYNGTSWSSDGSLGDVSDVPTSVSCVGDDYCMAVDDHGNAILGSFPAVPPMFTSATAATFTEGSADTFEVVATGSPTPTLSETGALPSGVSFTDNGDGTATIAGTASGTAGTYPIAITAIGAVGMTATQAFTLAVVAPSAPVFTSATSVTFATNQASTFLVTTTGYPVATLSETGALPPGVTFTDNGDGTATVAINPSGSTTISPGTYPITIAAENGVSSEATQAFTLTVQSWGESLPVAVAGQEYSALLTPPNGVKVVKKWKLAPGSKLPPGLKLAASGEITGTTKMLSKFVEPSTYTFTSLVYSSLKPPIWVSVLGSLPVGLGGTAIPDRCTKLWTPAASASPPDLWTDANNWTPKGVPDGNDTACVFSGTATLPFIPGEPPIDTEIEVGSLWINGGTVGGIGPLIVDRNLTLSQGTLADLDGAKASSAELAGGTIGTDLQVEGETDLIGSFNISGSDSLKTWGEVTATQDGTTISGNGEFQAWNGVDVTADAITMDEPFQLAGGQMTVGSTSTLNLDGAIPGYPGATFLQSNGIVDLAGSGATLNLNGSTYELLSGGFEGNGTVTGSIDNAGGTVIAGTFGSSYVDSPTAGTLSISGAYNQYAGGTLDVVVNPVAVLPGYPVPVIPNGSINAGSTSSLGGTANIILPDVLPQTSAVFLTFENPNQPPNTFAQVNSGNWAYTCSGQIFGATAASVSAVLLSNSLSYALSGYSLPNSPNVTNIDTNFGSVGYLANSTVPTEISFDQACRGPIDPISVAVDGQEWNDTGPTSTGLLDTGPGYFTLTPNTNYTAAITVGFGDGTFELINYPLPTTPNFSPPPAIQPNPPSYTPTYSGNPTSIGTVSWTYPSGAGNSGFDLAFFGPGSVDDTSLCGTPTSGTASHGLITTSVTCGPLTWNSPYALDVAPTFSPQTPIMPSFKVIPVNVPTPTYPAQCFVGDKWSTVAADFAAAGSLMKYDLVLVTPPIGPTDAKAVVYAQTPACGASANLGASLTTWTSDPVTVPNVKGDTYSVAAAALSAVNLIAAKATGSIEGSVINESPSAGTTLAPNKTVTLTLSNGLSSISLTNCEFSESQGQGYQMDVYELQPNGTWTMLPGDSSVASWDYESETEQYTECSTTPVSVDFTTLAPTEVRAVYPGLVTDNGEEYCFQEAQPYLDPDCYLYDSRPIYGDPNGTPNLPVVSGDLTDIG